MSQIERAHSLNSELLPTEEEIPIRIPRDDIVLATMCGVFLHYLTIDPMYTPPDERLSYKRNMIRATVDHARRPLIANGKLSPKKNRNQGYLLDESFLLLSSIETMILDAFGQNRRGHNAHVILGEAGLKKPEMIVHARRALPYLVFGERAKDGLSEDERVMVDMVKEKCIDKRRKKT